jgi:hypothetical protein
MAARKRVQCADNTREKIKATLLLKKLTEHVLGTVELSSTQVAAAKILLGKTLPDLSQVDMTAEVDATTTIIRKEYKPSK